MNKQHKNVCHVQEILYLWDCKVYAKTIYLTWL